MVKTGQTQHVVSIQYAPTRIHTIHNVCQAQRLRAPLLLLLKVLPRQPKVQLRQPQPKAPQVLPAQQIVSTS